MGEKSVNERVQEVEIDILRQIDGICKKYEIEYFAIGGTVLGAVRHQGFIPWDDDIDIAMPRKDYEKFLRVAQDELPKGYFVQNYFTEPNTPFYFTKIRKDNTLFVEYYLRGCKIHQGIFVDIFPFDAVPKNKWVRKIHFRICRALYQLFLAKSLTTACSSRFKQQDNYKSYLRKIAHALLFFFPKSWLFNALNHCVQIFNNRSTEEISHIVRKRLRVSLKELYPIQYLPFSGFQMPVPNDYDAYLKAQFGEYDILPPEEKRYGHLPYRVEFDLDEGDRS